MYLSGSYVFFGQLTIGDGSSTPALRRLPGLELLSGTTDLRLGFEEIGLEMGV